MRTPVQVLALASMTTLIGAPAAAGEAVSLRFDPSAAFASQPAEPPAPASPEGAPSSSVAPGPDAATGPELRFGRAGSRWWSIGTGAANDFDGSTDINVHGIYSTFLADELEFGVEAAGWYFNQEGQDTAGLSGSMIFRWHFTHADDWKWSVFTDFGIGILGAFDEVPDGGTGFDFLPRLGFGFTHDLGDNPEQGPRLTVGLRWHHISNARINGDERNPARDGPMIYAEVQFPF